MNAVETVLKKHPRAGRDALIPILQEVQENQGYLSREAVTLISKHLNLPATKIYGVATFYNQFRFQPKGKYHFTVCRGTACHVKGSNRVLEMAQKLLSLKAWPNVARSSFQSRSCCLYGGLRPISGDESQR